MKKVSQAYQTYICVFQRLSFPYEFFEIKFNAKNDTEAIKVYPHMYIRKELVKELKKQVNEKNILLIHSNKDFREIKAKSFD